MDAPRLTRHRANQLRRAMSLPEILLWRAIKPSVLPVGHFRRQHPLGPYILDFYSASGSLSVEVDGYSHASAIVPPVTRAGMRGWRGKAFGRCRQRRGPCCGTCKAWWTW